MKFQDVFVSREHMFSVGIEKESGRFYVSIPVSNGMVDYEEYYEIDRATFELFKRDPDAALPFVIRCRKRELDELLLIQPGRTEARRSDVSTSSTHISERTCGKER